MLLNGESKDLRLILVQGCPIRLHNIAHHSRHIGRP